MVDHLPPSGQPPLRLLAVPLTEWPASLLQRLRERWEISLGPLEDADSAGDAPLLLAYVHPAATLAAALTGQAIPDIAALLDDWQRVCGQMLALRRRWPDRALLIDPSQLDPAAEALLLERLDPHGGGSDTAAPNEAPTEEKSEAAPEPPPPLPAAVAFYLAQRSDLGQLFADLEGNAELLGREPRLRPAAPFPRGLVLAEYLLSDWHAELAEARREGVELRVRLLDSEEELGRTIEELSQARERGEEAEQRLARLEQECRTLFLHCQLSARIDRTRIATILQLMRESLQV